MIQPNIEILRGSDRQIDVWLSRDGAPLPGLADASMTAYLALRPGRPEEDAAHTIPDSEIVAVDAAAGHLRIPLPRAATEGLGALWYQLSIRVDLAGGGRVWFPEPPELPVIVRVHPAPVAVAAPE